MTSETLCQGITVHLGDCRDILATLPAESVDMIWTDPPYGHGNHNGDFNARLNNFREIENRPIASDSAGEMREVVECNVYGGRAYFENQLLLLLLLRRRRAASYICMGCGSHGPQRFIVLSFGNLGQVESWAWLALSPSARNGDGGA